MCISYKTLSVALHPLIFTCALLFAQVANSSTLTAPTPLAARNKLPAADGQPSAANPLGKQAEPVVVQKQIPVQFRQYNNVKLKPVRLSWSALSVAKFEPTNTSLISSASIGNEPVKTGMLTWQVTANGTRVLDSATGKTAFIAELTSADVRAKDIVFNERSGSVLFYGNSIYRYSLQNNELARLQSADEELRIIRKLVSTPSGLWFASNSGIFQLDEAGVSLSKLSHAAVEGSSMINIALLENEIWFVTSLGKLVRLYSVSQGRVDMAVSPALSAGVPAEFIGINQSLWMLLGNKLGYFDKGSSTVNIIAGKYFSLNQAGGQLMSSAYVTSYRIDPVDRTITKFEVSIPGSLERASHKDSVLFIGSSYAYKDGCEIVEHGVIDISKGWLQSLLKSTLLFR